MIFSLSYIDGRALHILLSFTQLGSLYVSFPYPSYLLPSWSFMVNLSFLPSPLLSSYMTSPIFLNLLLPRFLYGRLYLVPDTTPSIFLYVPPTVFVSLLLPNWLTIFHLWSYPLPFKSLQSLLSTPCSSISQFLSIAFAQLSLTDFKPTSQTQPTTSPEATPCSDSFFPFFFP